MNYKNNQRHKTKDNEKNNRAVCRCSAFLHKPRTSPKF